MTAWRVPLADLGLRDEDIDRVVETYRSGWLSMGPRTEELERRLEGFTGARHAVAVSSGTAALQLACLATGLGPGDEVIAPSLTFVATPNAIAAAGATPVFCDVAGLARPWLSAGAVEAALGERTRAVMAMHYAGHPGEAAALRDLCERRGLLLLEDAAHALGGSLGGRGLGTLGAAGALSFFANKNLAVGEGGAVLTGDPGIAERVRLLRSHGMTSGTWERRSAPAGSYDVVLRGFNFRMDEPRAALAASRLARLEEENARRAALAGRYERELSGVPGLALIDPPGADGRSAHHLFVVVLDAGIDRDELRRRLAADGVQTSVHYPPAHRFRIYAEGGARLPLTDDFAARAVTLPLFAHMSEEQQEIVLAALRSALRAARPAARPV